MTAAAAALQPADRAVLRGARLTFAWIAYVVLAGFTVAVYLPGFPGMVNGYRTLLPQDALWIWTVAVALLDTAIHTAVAAFIAWRRPRDGMAIFTSFALFAVGLGHSSLLGLFGPQDSLLVFVLFLVIGNGGILLLPFLFPDGRFVPRWGPWYWLVLYVGTEMIPFVVLPAPAALQFPLYGIELMLLGGVIAQIQRYRHHSTALQRTQAKWFLFGYLTFMVIWELNIRLSNFLFLYVFSGLAGESQDAARLAFNVIASTAQHAAGIAVPIAILIAMLRWRLFAIDLIINRTLVYATLTVILVALFAVASAVLQPLLAGMVGGATIANVTTALVVIGAFLPLRRALQSVADRFVPERALLAFLFTDLVSSTERASALGDQRWREVLDRFRAAVRRELALFEGREVDNAGEGFFATFRAPAQAVRCATAIRDAVRGLGLQTRTGIHVGECELRGSKVSGINVHTAARVMSAATPDEVLVSSTTRELVAGSQLQFADRGVHQLKGLPDEWRLYAVVGA